jgi:hypothetical protein
MKILEKIGAYFEACSESFVSEGQAYAMLREKRRAAAAIGGLGLLRRPHVSISD